MAVKALPRLLGHASRASLWCLAPSSMNHLKRLLRPLVVALLEPAEDRATHLKKRLRLPKRFIPQVLDYRQQCKGQLDEDLLLHHLSKLVHTRQHGGYYRSVFELLSWFTKHEERLQKIKSPTIARNPLLMTGPFQASRQLAGWRPFSTSPSPNSKRSLTFAVSMPRSRQEKATTTAIAGLPASGASIVCWRFPRSVSRRFSTPF